MTDMLRDRIPYFKTWLVFAKQSPEQNGLNSGESVTIIEEKLNSCKRALAQATEYKAYDLVSVFADIAGEIQELLESTKKKRAFAIVNTPGITTGSMPANQFDKSKFL